MALTLTTHDTRFDQLDDATIAKVLASLDGSRNVLATLERSELVYLQAEGGVRAGFVLEYQDGSLDQRFRSRAKGRLPRCPVAASVTNDKVRRRIRSRRVVDSFYHHPTAGRIAEGQQIVADSRIFIPLNAEQVRAELKKLD